MNIKDSGERSEFSTGAVRDCHKGKGRMDLLPVSAIIEVAKIFEAGAEKYEGRNWEKGIPVHRYVDSGLRHAMKWLRGDRDEPHLAQACWNFLCALDTVERVKDGRLPHGIYNTPGAAKDITLYPYTNGCDEEDSPCDCCVFGQDDDCMRVEKVAQQ